MVAAALDCAQTGRNHLRRGGDPPAPTRHARQYPEIFAEWAGALLARWRGLGVGFAGDLRVRRRDAARRLSLARGSRRPRRGPLDFGRDAFRVPGFARTSVDGCVTDDSAAS